MRRISHPFTINTCFVSDKKTGSYAMSFCQKRCRKIVVSGKKKDIYNCTSLCNLWASSNLFIILRVHIVVDFVNWIGLSGGVFCVSPFHFISAVGTFYLLLAYFEVLFRYLSFKTCTSFL